MTRHRIEPAGRAGGRLVLTGAEMRAADRKMIETIGLPGCALMETAGRHVAVAAAALCPPGRPIVVVCGRGNNGGDGLVAARHLADWGFTVEIVFCGEPSRATDDARAQLRVVEALALPLRVVTDADDFPHLPVPGHYGLVVDALLGTGLQGSVTGLMAEAVAWINGHGASVLAVDIPSGICSETGQVLGAAVRADATVTFAASKLGHWLFPGAAHTGALSIVDIGIPERLLTSGTPRRLLGDADLSPAFRPRARDGHKGTYGHVYVLAGSPGKTGAARMASDAALRAGAGLVTLGTTREAFRALGGELYETMSEVAIEPGEIAVSAAERLSHRLNRFQAVVIGPGLPAEAEIGDLLAQLLPRLDVPVVVDAEALNQLVWRKECFESAAPRVLTPHPGEAARLLGRTTAEVQADRVGAATALADDTGAVVILKAAHTLVAGPGGLGICPEGNPGMGTGGMGDVLSGMIGALLARGLDAETAARAGVLWHARAGDTAAARLTETTLLARDVLAELTTVERRSC